jgi:hypothetical protein
MKIREEGGEGVAKRGLGFSESFVNNFFIYSKPGF